MNFPSILCLEEPPGAFSLCLLIYVLGSKTCSKDGIEHRLRFELLYKEENSLGEKTRGQKMSHEKYFTAYFHENESTAAQT